MRWARSQADSSAGGQLLTRSPASLLSSNTSKAALPPAPINCTAVPDRDLTAGTQSETERAAVQDAIALSPPESVEPTRHATAVFQTLCSISQREVTLASRYSVRTDVGLISRTNVQHG